MVVLPFLAVTEPDLQPRVERVNFSEPSATFSRVLVSPLNWIWTVSATTGLKFLRTLKDTLTSTELPVHSAEDGEMEASSEVGKQ